MWSVLFERHISSCGVSYVELASFRPIQISKETFECGLGGRLSLWNRFKQILSSFFYRCCCTNDPNKIKTTEIMYTNTLKSEQKRSIVEKNKNSIRYCCYGTLRDIYATEIVFCNSNNAHCATNIYNTIRLICVEHYITYRRYIRVRSSVSSIYIYIIQIQIIHKVI